MDLSQSINFSMRLDFVLILLPDENYRESNFNKSISVNNVWKVNSHCWEKYRAHSSIIYNLISWKWLAMNQFSLSSAVQSASGVCLLSIDLQIANFKILINMTRTPVLVIYYLGVLILVFQSFVLTFLWNFSQKSQNSKIWADWRAVVRTIFLAAFPFFVD